MERLRPLLPALGITRVANVTGLDRLGVPVVMVCRPNSRSLAVSQGKGLTLAAARASGLMEAAEAFHAERITLPLKLGSVEDLGQSHRLVDATRLPRTTASVFHPHLPLLWIEGYDLLQRQPVWVPYELVHLNLTLPRPAGHGSFLTTSSGLAAGNHPLEAVSRAICEVVERDAIALWPLLPPTARRGARVDPATVDDPGCREVLAKLEGAGIDVAVWELTSDIDLPVFRCVIAERWPDDLHPVAGYEGTGCHPTRQVALLRALTEAAQARLTWITGSRDDRFREDYERLHHPDTQRSLRALLTAGVPRRDFRDAPTFDGDTLEADVTWELGRLRGVGVDRVVVVDLTRPDLGLPVVRVVIPGLEVGAAGAGYVYGARAGALAARHGAGFVW